MDLVNFQFTALIVIFEISSSQLPNSMIFRQLKGGERFIQLVNWICDIDLKGILLLKKYQIIFFLQLFGRNIAINCSRLSIRASNIHEM